MTAAASEPEWEPVWLHAAGELFPKLIAEFLADPPRFRKLQAFMDLLPTNEDRLLYLQLTDASKLQPDDPVFQNAVAVMCIASRLTGSTLKKEMGVVFEAVATSDQLFTGLNKAIASTRNALEKMTKGVDRQHDKVNALVGEVDHLVSAVSAQVDMINGRIAESIKAAGKQVQDAAITGVDTQIEAKVSEKIDLKSKELLEQIGAASDLFKQLGPHVATMAATFTEVNDAKPLVLAGRAFHRKTVISNAVCAVVFLLLGLAVGAGVINKPVPVALTPATLTSIEKARSLDAAWPYLDEPTKAKLEEAIRTHG